MADNSLIGCLLLRHLSELRKGDNYDDSLLYVRLCRMSKTHVSEWRDLPVPSPDDPPDAPNERKEIVRRAKMSAFKNEARKRLATAEQAFVYTPNQVYSFLRRNDMFRLDDPYDPLAKDHRWYGTAFQAARTKSHYYTVGERVVDHPMIFSGVQKYDDKYEELLVKQIDGSPYQEYMALNAECYEAMVMAERFPIRSKVWLKENFKDVYLAAALNASGFLANGAITAAEIYGMFPRHNRRIMFHALLVSGHFTDCKLTFESLKERFFAEKRVFADVMTASGLNAAYHVRDLSKMFGKTTLYYAMSDAHFTAEQDVEWWNQHISTGAHLFDVLKRTGQLAECDAEKVLALFQSGEWRYKALLEADLLSPDLGRAWYTRAFTSKKWLQSALINAGVPEDPVPEPAPAASDSSSDSGSSDSDSSSSDSDSSGSDSE